MKKGLQFYATQRKLTWQWDCGVSVTGLTGKNRLPALTCSIQSYTQAAEGHTGDLPRTAVLTRQKSKWIGKREYSCGEKKIISRVNGLVKKLIDCTVPVDK